MSQREMVPNFGDAAAEYAALRQTAGLWEAAFLGCLRLTGADRAAFLHNLLTNDITHLAPGRGCRAALVTPAAKLLADVFVLAEPEAHWLLMDAARVETVLATLERYHITEDVHLEDVTPRTVAIGLSGPSVATILSRVGLGELPSEAWSHRRAALDDVPLHLIRFDGFGVVGALLLAQAEVRIWLRETLLERASAQGLRPA